MGDPVNITDLARRLVELSGLVPDRDVKIEYTGLRAGEKLEESLVDEAEGSVSRTGTPGILILKSNQDLRLTDLTLRELTQAALRDDREAIASVLSQLGIGYRGQGGVEDLSPALTMASARRGSRSRPWTRSAS